MLKEIQEMKFRGKRLDNGEWIKSHSVLRMGEWEYPLVSIYLQGERGKLIQLFTDNAGMNATRVDGHLYKVDPETVGRYTGLKDKNGVEIYEGDILKFADNDNELYYVSWYEGDGMFALNRCGYGYFDNLVGWNERKRLWEVVGNIHDNPEMLNGGVS